MGVEDHEPTIAPNGRQWPRTRHCAGSHSILVVVAESSSQIHPTSARRLKRQQNSEPQPRSFSATLDIRFRESGCFQESIWSNETM